MPSRKFGLTTPIAWPNWSIISPTWRITGKAGTGRNYESLEGDLALSARHDGYGHVVVEVVLKNQEDGWSCTGLVTTDPGEQMSEAARGARVMLAPSA